MGAPLMLLLMILVCSKTMFPVTMTCSLTCGMTQSISSILMTLDDQLNPLPCITSDSPAQSMQYNMVLGK